jgi:Putative transposase
VLAYLSRYTHRIAIANSRLVVFDGERVTFKWKDYRAKADARYKLMTLDADEFIRRFLIHVLPDGFHRIRHYGLFANANRADNIALARRLLSVPDPAPWSDDSDRADGGHEDEERNIVLAAVGVWSPSRPSNPAASRDCGPFQQSASTAHDQHAPVAIPHCRASSRPMSHRRRLPSANRNCQRRLPPPKRRSLTTTPPFRSGTRRPKPTLR